MDKLSALVVSGAVSGAVYSLLAVGLVLTYSTSRIFNFAQGAIAFAATLLFYELTQGFGWPVVPALVVSIALIAALGAGVNEVVFRRLADAQDATRIVATVGLSIAIPAIALLIVEVAVDTFHVDIPRGDNIVFPPGLGPAPKHIWNVGSITIDSNQAIALVVAVVAVGGLWLLVTATRTGLRMRAAVDRRALAEYRGIDSLAVSRLAYALSFGIAALAGIAGAPFFSLTPSSYTAMMVVASAAAVFARLRSLPLALLGGLLLGLAQSLFSGYVHVFEDIPGLASAVPYVLLFGCLLFLARDRTRAAGQVAEVVPADPLGALPWWRRALPWAVASVAIVASLYVVSEYQLGLLTRGLALAVIFLSFTVVTGIGGMVSLAQASFALFASVLAGKLIDSGMPLFPAAGVAIAATALVGALFALPSLRLGGLALALSTLALALIGDTVLFAYKPFTNGSYGWTMPRPTIGPFDFGPDRPLAVLLLVIVLLLVAAIGNLRRSPSGRAMLAVRSSEAAASSVGLSMARTKLRVFTISAAIAGLGGVMLASVNRSVSTASIPVEIGLTWLAIVVLMGIRRPAGAVLGALVFVLSPEIIGTFTTSTRIQDILFGLGAVQLAKSPDGILTAATAARHRWQGRRVVSAADRADDPPTTTVAAGVAAAAAQVPSVVTPTGEAAANVSPLPVATGEPGADVPAGAGVAGAAVPATAGGSSPGLRAPSPATPATGEPGEGAAAGGAATTSAPGAVSSAAADASSAGPVPHAGAPAEAGLTDVVAAAGGSGRNGGGMVLAMRGVAGGYDQVEVLHGVDLDVRPGAITVLLGAGGAGKSTLCAVVGGEVDATAGSVRFLDHDVTGLAGHRRARLGMASAPESWGIFPGLSVAENLALVLPAAADRELALERFPALAERRRVEAGYLSGGEQQMLALAPLVIHPPKLLIADEPSLGLAPLIVEQVLALLVELRDAGSAILLSEEKATRVMQVADHVAFLTLGRVTWTGPAGEVDLARLTDAYLEARR